MRLKNEGDIYLETCNYIDALLHDTRLSPVVLCIHKENDNFFDNYNKLKDDVVLRLNTIAENLRKILSTSLDAKTVNDLFKDFDDIASKRARTLGTEMWIDLEQDLRGICFCICQKYGNVDTSPITVKNGNSLSFKSSDEDLLSKIHDYSEYLKIIKKTSVWAAWGRLMLIYRSVYSTKKDIRKAWDKDWLVGADLAGYVSEMKRIIGINTSLETLSARPSIRSIHFNPELTLIDLQRIHNFALDRLNRTSLGLALLKKYKQRCEWFESEELLKYTDNMDDKKRQKIEDELTRKLCIYLLDNNVIPLSEVSFGVSRPDVLLQSQEELFPIEVKVAKYHEKSRVKKGFNQIITYIRTIGASEGFYIIFCRGDFILQIPEKVFTDSYRINIITIDLPETSPSKRSPNVWTLTQEELLT